MKVSIVMAVYNREQLVTECIESILNQSMSDFEIIAVDDCSEDDTVGVLCSLSRKDSRVKVLSNTRHQFIETLNMGMDAAHGEYIARIDSDDIMQPDRLVKQVSCLDRDPSLAVCCTWAETFPDRRIIGTAANGKIKQIYRRLLLGNFLVNPTSMVRKSFLDKHHLRYREKYIYSEDYKLWSEIAGLGGEFYVLPQCLTKYRIHDDQLSIKHRKVQDDSAFMTQTDMLNDIVERCSKEDERIKTLFQILESLNNDGVIDAKTLFYFGYELSGKERPNL